MIAMRFQQPRVPRLYNEGDIPWVEDLIAVAAAKLGRPWRELIERVESSHIGPHASHRTAMLGALRRLLGGAVMQGERARHVRSITLGAPALSTRWRHDRIEHVARQLGTTPDEIESLLWLDLARERPVAFFAGRPAARDVIAVANLEQLHSLTRRARELRLQLAASSEHLAREATRHGVIMQVMPERTATKLHVMGPIAFGRVMSAYGRAVGALIAMLGDQPHFVLDVRAEIDDALQDIRIASPVMLPRDISPPRRKNTLGYRLARDLTARGCFVDWEPPPLLLARQQVFPDLIIHEGQERWLHEVQRYSTPTFLERRLELYRAANLRAVVCVNSEHVPRCDDHLAACGYERRVDPEDIVAMMRGGP